MRVRNIYFLLLFSMILLSFQAKSQCETKNTAFKDGERLVFQIYYHWGLVWVNAGEAIFLVDSTTKQGKPVYHYKSLGWSHKEYNWIYKVRSLYQAWADVKTLEPLWFERKSHEGGLDTHNKYEFDNDRKIIYTETENSNKSYTEDTVEYTRCVHDVLSAIYHTRNIDFSKYDEGEKIPIDFIVDNELYQVYITYLGKETVKAKDKKKYRCLKFEAYMPPGTLFTEGDGHFVWVTDDENRVPILVDASIVVGSIKVYFESGDNLLHETTSLVED